jgi:hypothetical protein
MKLQVDAKTGKAQVVSFNEEDKALIAHTQSVSSSISDVITADAAAKQSAIDKLAALGLSVDEIRAAFGLEGN